MVCSQPVVPCVGMEFDTIDEARRVYNEYAYKMGFSIRVASHRTSQVTKEVIRKEFECNHASQMKRVETTPLLAHQPMIPQHRSQ